MHLQSHSSKQLRDTDQSHTAILVPKLPLLLLGVEGKGDNLNNFCSLKYDKRPHSAQA